MGEKPSAILEYFTWILKKYQEIQQQTQQLDAFRIIEIKKNKHGECIVKVQLIGKATVFECTPHEIVANDQIIEGFSKKDIRTLTYFATHEIRKPKYKILVQEFSDVLNKIKFKLGRRGSSEPIEKTAEQISLDKEFINKLNSEDAHLVGYVTATEQMTREKEEMERLRNVHI
jgi:hypothetical protein